MNGGQVDGLTGSSTASSYLSRQPLSEAFDTRTRQSRGLCRCSKFILPLWPFIPAALNSSW